MGKFLYLCINHSLYLFKSIEMFGVGWLVCWICDALLVLIVCDNMLLVKRFYELRKRLKANLEIMSLCCCFSWWLFKNVFINSGFVKKILYLFYKIYYDFSHLVVVLNFFNGFSKRWFYFLCFFLPEVLDWLLKNGQLAL